MDRRGCGEAEKMSAWSQDSRAAAALWPSTICGTYLCYPTVGNAASTEAAAT
jgi:hypothetical protein